MRASKDPDRIGMMINTIPATSQANQRIFRLCLIIETRAATANVRLEATAKTMPASTSDASFLRPVTARIRATIVITRDEQRHMTAD